MVRCIQGSDGCARRSCDVTPTPCFKVHATGVAENNMAIFWLRRQTLATKLNVLAMNPVADGSG